MGALNSLGIKFFDLYGEELDGIGENLIIVNRIIIPVSLNH